MIDRRLVSGRMGEHDLHSAMRLLGPTLSLKQQSLGRVERGEIGRPPSIVGIALFEVRRSPIQEVLGLFEERRRARLRRSMPSARISSIGGVGSL